MGDSSTLTPLGWSDVIERLLVGEDLLPPAATWAMDQILSGSSTPAQTAGFLVALRAKGETSAELTGLVAGMLNHAERLTVSGPLVDTCGTGGDGAHTVNISSMAAVVAAAAGARVVKHGNRAASSRSGSADVFEALGVAVDLKPERALACLEQVGITFLFAPVFHPAMRFAGPVRRELGIRTVFNMLGPLANPASPSAQVVGVPNAAVGELLSGVLAARGTRSLVVLGHGGLDELTGDGPAKVWSTLKGDGTVEVGAVDPAGLGISAPAPDALKGGDPAQNAQIFREVLAGVNSPAVNAVRDVVALNAAAALVAFESSDFGQAHPVSRDQIDVAGLLREALPRTFHALTSGSAEKLLSAWIEAGAALRD